MERGGWEGGREGRTARGWDPIVSAALVRAGGWEGVGGDPIVSAGLVEVEGAAFGGVDVGGNRSCEGEGVGGGGEGAGAGQAGGGGVEGEEGSARARVCN